MNCRQVRVLFICLTLIFPAALRAQSVVPTPLRCTPPGEDFDGREVFARYEGRNRRLILVSTTSGRLVREIETSLDVPGFAVRGWSPDCRYLSAYLGVDDTRDTVIWDVVENVRVGLLANSWSLAPDWWWSPDGEWLLLSTLRRGGWLWHLPSGAQFQLTDQIDMMGRSFLRVEWDEARGLLLLVMVEHPDDTLAYDLSALRQQSATPTPAGS
jgi:hypothetical protein